MCLNSLDLSAFYSIIVVVNMYLNRIFLKSVDNFKHF